MGVHDATLVQELMQLGHYPLGVRDVLILALARIGATTLERPGQANRVATMGWDLSILPIHHGRDRGMPRSGEPGEDALVSSRVHRGGSTHGCTLRIGPQLSTRFILLEGEEVVPSRRQRGHGVRTV